jgi:glycosyltransferase involved in cell wall biosynthesis
VPATSRLARAFEPDVLSVFYGIPTGLAGLVTRWRHRTPMVLSYVGRDVPGPGTPPGWKFYHRLLVRSADATTYISDYCRRAIFGAADRGTGVTVGNGTQVYPPAEPARVERLRLSLGIAPETTVLFALQRLSAYKGVDVLIRSLSYLKDRRCVLLVTGDGADRPRLEDIVKSEGLGDTVRVLGFVPEDDLPAFWGLADIFVFHSFYETFGMVLAEAMSAGKAVVSVDSTAIPEVVEHGRHGLLVPPGDPAAMAAAIRRLIDDPAMRAAFGAAGRARVEREFNWDNVARAYETVFEGVRHGQ